MDTTAPPFPLPGTGRADVVVEPPGPGPQQWAGAPAALLLDDGTWLVAYRVRGGGTDHVVLARSDDGVRMTTIGEVHPSAVDATMVERPALAVTEDGRWRMWVSGAERGTKRWFVELLEADSPESLCSGRVRSGFPRHPDFGVKDPVVRRRGDRWEAWLCCHPLDVPGAEDRMRTAYATSSDGLSWDWHGDVLTGRPGRWDARGARLTAVLDDGRIAYDGRASAEENWFEQTGLAVPTPEGALRSVSDQPAVDVRYLCPVALPGGGWRLWYERRRADESHELVTELITPQ